MVKLISSLLLKCLSIVLCIVTCVSILPATIVWASSTDAQEESVIPHTKVVSGPEADGSYTLRLNVQGKLREENHQRPLHVYLLVDMSNSMYQANQLANRVHLGYWEGNGPNGISSFTRNPRHDKAIADYIRAHNSESNAFRLVDENGRILRYAANQNPNASRTPGAIRDGLAIKALDDRSSAMQDTFKGNVYKLDDSRITIEKDALKRLADSFTGSGINPEDVMIHLVPFSYAPRSSTNVNSVAGFKAAVDSFRAEGDRTYWAGAINYALDDPIEGGSKFIVLLTDGSPTGADSSEGVSAENVYSEIKDKVKATQNLVNMYGIYFGDPRDGSAYSRMNKLFSLVKADNDALTPEAYRPNNSEDLIGNIRTIFTQVISYKQPVNVTIHDVLTPWVKLAPLQAGDQADAISYEYSDSNGNVTQLTPGQDVNPARIVSENGKPKVEWQPLGQNATLSTNGTYTLKIKVKPSDALQADLNNAAPSHQDLTYPTNDETSRVTYQIKTSTLNPNTNRYEQSISSDVMTEYYEVPTIGFSRVNIKKVWKGSTSTDLHATVALYQSSAQDPFEEITLTPDAPSKVIVLPEPTDDGTTTYRVAETQANGNFELQGYTVDSQSWSVVSEGDSPGVVTTLSKGSHSNATITITNRLSKTIALRIEKYDEDNEALAGAVFGLRQIQPELVRDYTQKTTASNGQILFSDLKVTDSDVAVRYQLREITPPQGYSAAGPFFIEIYEDGATLLDARGAVIGASRGMKKETDAAGNITYVLKLTDQTNRSATLPNTAGPGIGWLLFGGAVLIFFAAAFIARVVVTQGNVLRRR